MEPPVKRVVLSGYYGFRNSGDEAVLQSILFALREAGEAQGIRFEPIVLSADPAWTERTYGVRAAHRMKPAALLGAIRSADALISGGGSLLQDVTGGLTIPYYIGVIKLAQWLRKPVFIYSQGIGPVLNRKYDKWIRGAFARCRYVSVRDRESAELLERMGCPSGGADVVPDPVMGLPLPAGESAPSPAATSALCDNADAFPSPVAAEPSASSRPVIGISVRFWNEDHSELERLAETLLLVAARRDVTLRFLPFHQPADEEASQEVIRRMQAAASPQTPGARSLALPPLSVQRGLDHPQEMLAAVSRCDLLIGMRLHSLIYAASQYVPMIGITYDPKIDQFLQRLEMAPVASTARFDVDAAADAIQALLDGKAEWIAAKRPLIDRLKDEANRPAQQIAACLRLKGGRV